MSDNIRWEIVNNYVRLWQEHRRICNIGTTHTAELLLRCAGILWDNATIAERDMIIRKTRA